MMASPRPGAASGLVPDESQIKVRREPREVTNLDGLVVDHVTCNAVVLNEIVG